MFFSLEPTNPEKHRQLCLAACSPKPHVKTEKHKDT